jgi:predicted Ser/Thr protein kinase
VVKDFAPRGRWIRETWGRWNLNRELRAYRALAGHPAVPRLLGRIDALAIAIEYRAGKRLPVGLKGRDPSAFGAALDEAVRGMHARGVVHLDLRHRSNVLVDDATRPVLIDFASALCFTPGGRLHRWLLPWLARVDLRAVAKWRQRIESGAQRAGSPAARRGASRPT